MVAKGYEHRMMLRFKHFPEEKQPGVEIDRNIGGYDNSVKVSRGFKMGEQHLAIAIKRGGNLGERNIATKHKLAKRKWAV